ncbi:GNAT family N-acetyltransferase [Plantactinospora sp. GCM10030261]|uniref:GNAT family N-acetyltransferase n=1 Tax=Plantactinospora sp. GCM10030261 TaxID=3273420 RepID=UPI003619A2BA
MTQQGTPVVRATDADADTLTNVLATAFLADPISQWIFPDYADRERLHPAFFRPFVDMTLAEGEVWTTEDRSAVALWLPVDVTAHAEAEDLGPIFEQAVGPEYAKRFAVLDKLMTDGHPGHENHHYLPFIAVRPERQGHGVGATLLGHRLATLDEIGAPAYLEASCLRNAALYERLGFQRMDNTIDLPDGPSLYPMWRRPA